MLEKAKEEKADVDARKKKMKVLSLNAGLARGLGSLLSNSKKKGSLNLSKRGSSITSKGTDFQSKLGSMLKAKG